MTPSEYQAGFEFRWEGYRIHVDPVVPDANPHFQIEILRKAEGCSEYKFRLILSDECVNNAERCRLSGYSSRSFLASLPASESGASKTAFFEAFPGRLFVVRFQKGLPHFDKALCALAFASFSVSAFSAARRSMAFF